MTRHIGKGHEANILTVLDACLCAGQPSNQASDDVRCRERTTADADGTSLRRSDEPHPRQAPPMLGFGTKRS